MSEASDGDRLYQGYAYVVPGDWHGRIRSDRKGYYIELDREEPVNFFRPSVDVLFSSAAMVRDVSVAGIILTGMGADGVKGMKEMRDAGPEYIAQDRESSAVYGMPREALVRGPPCAARP